MPCAWCGSATRTTPRTSTTTAGPAPAPAIPPPGQHPAPAHPAPLRQCPKPADAHQIQRLHARGRRHAHVCGRGPERVPAAGDRSRSISTASSKPLNGAVEMLRQAQHDGRESIALLS
uniref:Uncharacterized protein n=1 Tax=Tanacetum cinerariifolium TaxID=118510 RepID=A0A699TK25_TANCI|nr:hypothetical protein [Tanacetum cinerariifolium]